MDNPSMQARATLMARLQETLRREQAVQAAWLEGADAWGCADEYSDLDLWVDVLPGKEEDVLALVRGVVESFGPLNVDVWQFHPHPLIQQRFYRSVGLPPFVFLDVCVQTHGREVTFTEMEPFLPWFDRADVLQQGAGAVLDVQLEADKLLWRQWRSVLVHKELRRGHHLEALAYYRQEVLSPLEQLLRLRYCPQKASYGLKHIERDLPPEAVKGLLSLHSLVEPEDLKRGVSWALQWMQEIVDELKNRGDQA